MSGYRPRLVIVAAVLIMLTPGLQAEAVSPGADADAWSVAEGTHEGLPLLIRFRPKLLERSDRRLFPIRLSVSWTYSKGASGMPSQDDLDEMNHFEDALVRLVETSSHGVFAAAITNAGVREWIFYVEDDLARTSAAIHDVPQKAEPYPLTIERSKDPEWAFFADLLAGMKQ